MESHFYYILFQVLVNRVIIGYKFQVSGTVQLSSQIFLIKMGPKAKYTPDLTDSPRTTCRLFMAFMAL